MNPQPFCNYTLLNELGRGGVSTVYRARDSRTGKLVALKVLNKQKQVDANVRERFRRESKFQFLHPRIVPVMETDSCGGQLYFTMELVEGESLEHKIQRGPLTPRQLYPYLRHVADALDAAHQRGIVHRDIKPSNILIRAADDTALLTDFGVAKLTTPAAANAAPITQASLHLIGTADYVSPEVAGGTGDATFASDIYSLGVTAYFALAGRLPFVTDNPLIVAHKHANEVPPPLRRVNPRLPDPVSRAVMQALNKNPRERYTSAGAFANAFTEAVMHSQGRAVLPQPNRLVWMGLAAVVIVAFALVTWLANIRANGANGNAPASSAPASSAPATTTVPLGVAARTAMASATGLSAVALAPTVQEVEATGDVPTPTALAVVASAATTQLTQAPATSQVDGTSPDPEDQPTATLEPTVTPLPPTRTPGVGATAPPRNTLAAGATVAGAANRPGGRTIAVVYNGGGYETWGQPRGVCGANGFDDTQPTLRFEVNLNLSNTSPQDTLAGLSAQFFDTSGAAMLTCYVETTGPLQPNQGGRVRFATFTPARNVGSVVVLLGGVRQRLCFIGAAAQICT